jgi:hypothetical protein
MASKAIIDRELLSLMNCKDSVFRVSKLVNTIIKFCLISILLQINYHFMRGSRVSQEIKVVLLRLLYISGKTFFARKAILSVLPWEGKMPR